MADGQKPYRVYRGGRVKGKVPTLTRPEPRATDGSTGGRTDYRGPGPKPKKKRIRLSKGKIVGLVLILLVVLVVVWAVAGYLAFRNGVSAANKRLGADARAALNKQDGALVSNPTDILLLGSDHADTAARAGDRHSDAIMLVRSDPDHHRIVYLSIPRDLRVSIPGHGEDKINAAFQIGGAPLAIRTVRDFTGLPVNHVALVDFASFRDLIDKIGGVNIDVPKPILSNPFDCPYTAEKCATWKGYRYAKGKQHMDGRHALVYSRIRENQLDPRENDITRGERQQQVMQAVQNKLAGFGTLVKMPFIGGDLLKPLATDLTAGQFLQLGWVKFRGHTLHCRLGGIPTNIGGGAYLQPDEESRAVIQMVKGTSAPQPPLPGTLYGSGCPNS
jgi:polyisoprenyl-teichoic acid--peptidoglycan teichoic acid transferase